MTTGSAARLLARHEPDEAFDDRERAQPARRRRWPRVFTRWPDLAESLAARRRARDHPQRCWQRCADAGVDVVMAHDPRYPAQLADDPAARRRCSSAATSTSLDARRVGIVGTRNADPAGRCDRGPLRRRAGRRRGGRGRVGSGAGHRRRGPPWRARSRRRGPGRGRRQRSRSCRIPAGNAELWEWVAAARGRHVRVAAGHAARRVPVPAAQPHPRRARARCSSWSRAASAAAA